MIKYGDNNNIIECQKNFDEIKSNNIFLMHN